LRSRLVIPAALLVTAVYLKGRLDASAGRRDARPPAPAPDPIDPIVRAEAEAADAVFIAAAQTAVTTIPRPRAQEPSEAAIDEAGRFSIGGWAAQAGHMSFCAVSFRDRRDEVVDASSIRLLTDATTNVSEGGLVVLADPGFAPDLEGFTIVVAAAGPGGFAAAGRYEVTAP
jgi:hypothetical protein